VVRLHDEAFTGAVEQVEIDLALLVGLKHRSPP
jgi:hypothetical protein